VNQLFIVTELPLENIYIFWEAGHLVENVGELGGDDRLLEFDEVGDRESEVLLRHVVDRGTQSAEQLVCYLVVLFIPCRERADLDKDVEYAANVLNRKLLVHQHRLDCAEEC